MTLGDDFSQVKVSRVCFSQDIYMYLRCGCQIKDLFRAQKSLLRFCLSLRDNAPILSRWFPANELVRDGCRCLVGESNPGLLFRVQYSTSTESYKNSFFPKTIPLWNRLPATVAEAPSLVSFKRGLSDLSFIWGFFSQP